MALTNPQAADHIAAEAGTFEPQRQNNFSFEVALGSADKDVIVMALQGFALPNESNDPVEVPYQNEKRKVAGQYGVDDMQLTVRDYVDVDVRGAIMRWRKKVYDPQTGKIGLAKDYKKTGWIILTAPDGTSRRVCKCKGCWPQAVNGGSLAMDSADQIQIEVTLSVDKADWSESLVGS